jgi:cephalosporin hydroxylase
MQWINDLKVFIIDKDINHIQKHIEDMPQINDIKNAKEAQALITEAIKLIEDEKTKVFSSMQKLKKIKKFI